MILFCLAFKIIRYSKNINLELTRLAVYMIWALFSSYSFNTVHQKEPGTVCIICGYFLLLFSFCLRIMEIGAEMSIVPGNVQTIQETRRVISLPRVCPSSSQTLGTSGTDSIIHQRRSAFGGRAPAGDSAWSRYLADILPALVLLFNTRWESKDLYLVWIFNDGPYKEN